MKPHMHPPEKACAVCGGCFARRSDETMTNFRRRRTCGPMCKYQFMSSARTTIPLEEVARQWNESRTVDDAAKALGVSVERLRGLRNTARTKGLKLKRQWHQQEVTIVHGVQMTLAEVAAMTGCHVETIRYRIKHGLNVVMRPSKGARGSRNGARKRRELSDR